jgi:hypothetical protein
MSPGPIGYSWDPSKWLGLSTSPGTEWSGQGDLDGRPTLATMKRLAAGIGIRWFVTRSTYMESHGGWFDVLKPATSISLTIQRPCTVSIMFLDCTQLNTSIMLSDRRRAHEQLCLRANPKQVVQSVSSQAMAKAVFIPKSLMQPADKVSNNVASLPARVSQGTQRLKRRTDCLLLTQIHSSYQTNLCLQLPVCARIAYLRPPTATM